MEEPQHLVTLVFLQSTFLALECRSIVATNLFVTKTLRPGTDHVSVAEEVNGHKASWVVGSHRREDNKGLALGHS